MEPKIITHTTMTKPAKYTLGDVQKKFETWRKRRKKRTPIPRELWESAIALSSDYTTYEISKALSIHFTRLEKQILSARGDQSIIKKSTPSFIELNLGKNNSTAECIVEVENRASSRMKIYFKGNPSLDLMEFGKAFLNQTA